LLIVYLCKDYRELLDLVPSELPFLTRSTGPWAFSALNQMFVVEGSCPNIDIINLPIFGALNVLTHNIQGKDQEIEFSFKNNGTDVHSISLVYTNQQNLPIVEKPKIVSVKDDIVTFKAFFPFEKFISESIHVREINVYRETDLFKSERSDNRRRHQQCWPIRER
jgi:hypothetical protein